MSEKSDTMQRRGSPVSWVWCVWVLLATAVIPGEHVFAQEPGILTVPSAWFSLAKAVRDDASSALRTRLPIEPQEIYRLDPPSDETRSAKYLRRGVGPSPLEVGFGRDLTRSGETAPSAKLFLWQRQPDGGLATAFAVVSPTAGALRLQLEVHNAPADLEIRVYAPDAPARTVERVPHTAVTLKPTLIWSPTVPGDTAAVELYLPSETLPPDLQVTVPRLSHLNADPRKLEDVDNSYCSHVDVVCRADRISVAARNAVAKYLFTTDSGYTAKCTGTLLNDTDPDTQIPYFLTARHCVGSQSEASSMEFYWFYERETCGGPGPTNITRQTGGATQLAFDALTAGVGTGTDHLLVRLNTDPPEGVGMSGWTTLSVSPGDSLVGVYHPAGDLKKLLTGTVSGFEDWGDWPTESGDSNIVVVPEVSPESGSSGSGLWIRINGVDYLVGVLSGGSAFSCTSRGEYYGRFDRFHTDLAQWLGSATTILNQVTGVSVTVGAGNLAVSWSAVTGADGYEVQWKSGSESYDASRQALVSEGLTTNHTITGLTAGILYTVRVRATKAMSPAGAWSAEAMGTPQASVPSPPPPLPTSPPDPQPPPDGDGASPTTVPSAPGRHGCSLLPPRS